MRKLIDKVEDVFKEIQEENTGLPWAWDGVQSVPRGHISREIASDGEFRAGNGRIIELNFRR